MSELKQRIEQDICDWNKPSQVASSLTADMVTVVERIVRSEIIKELEGLRENLNDHPDTEVPSENLNAQECGEVFGYNEATEEIFEALDSRINHWKEKV